MMMMSFLMASPSLITTSLSPLIVPPSLLVRFSSVVVRSLRGRLLGQGEARAVHVYVKGLLDPALLGDRNLKLELLKCLQLVEAAVPRVEDLIELYNFLG